MKIYRILQSTIRSYDSRSHLPLIILHKVPVLTTLMVVLFGLYSKVVDEFGYGIEILHSKLLHSRSWYYQSIPHSGINNLRRRQLSSFFYFLLLFSKGMNELVPEIKLMVGMQNRVNEFKENEIQHYKVLAYNLHMVVCNQKLHCSPKSSQTLINHNGTYIHSLVGWHELYMHFQFRFTINTSQCLFYRHQVLLQ